MTSQDYKDALGRIYTLAPDMPSIEEARIELMEEAIIALLEKVSP